MRSVVPWAMFSVAAMLSGSATQQAWHSTGVPPQVHQQQEQAVATYPQINVRPRPVLTMIGVASWYSTADPGIQPLTASGEPFDDTQLTCAAWNLPFDTRLQVTNLETGRQIVVRVNDRGPARRLVAQGRVVDLSKAAFRQIASLSRGLVPVKVELLTD